MSHVDFAAGIVAVVVVLVGWALATSRVRPWL
jgi:hypothetical protein